MTQLTKEQYQEYLKDKVAGDSKIRKWCNIPENKYYTVTTWPEHLEGRVYLNNTLHRTPTVKKISKSDQ